MVKFYLIKQRAENHLTAGEKSKVPAREVKSKRGEAQQSHDKCPVWVSEGSDRQVRGVGAAIDC